MPTQFVRTFLECVLPLFLLLFKINTSNAVILTENGTLDHYLCGLGPTILESNTELLLSPKVNHNLERNQFCLVSNLSNITIKSLLNGVLANVSCNSSNKISDVGFGFYNVSNLMIKDINITHCGGHIPTNKSFVYPNDGNFYFAERLLVVLIISNSTNSSLINLHTMYCYGLSIVLLNLHDHVLLQDISIQHSNHQETTNGSGLLLMMSTDSNLNCSIHVYNCALIGNGATIYNLDINDLLMTEVPVSAFAACLTVIFSRGNYTASLNITKLKMSHCLGGYYGGFAAIHHGAPVNKTQISMQKIELHHNVYGAFSETAFGILVCCENHKNHKQQSSVWNFLHLENVAIFDTRFSNHPSNDYERQSSHAHAAVIYISTRLDNVDIGVVFSSIQYNQYFYGYSNPFIVVRNYGMQTSSDSHLLMYINNFILTTNVSIHKMESVTALDYGKMVFINVELYIEGNENLFTNQTGSVIQAYNTRIHFRGIAKFVRNRAYQGAAISLHSSSQLYIYETTNITFEKNRAFFYGGALYSDVDGRTKYLNPLCTLQVVLNNVSSHKLPIMTFKDNSAGRAGMSVYMDPLYGCKQLHTPLSTISLNLLYLEIFKFDNKTKSTKHQEQVSSAPETVHFCGKLSQTTIKNVFPGQTLTFLLQSHDKNNNTPYSMIQARFIAGVGKTEIDIPLQIYKNQEFQVVLSNHCSKLNYTIIPNGVNTFQRMRLELSVQGYEPTLSIHVKIRPCPVGFYYRNNKTCDCNIFLTQRGIKQCSIDNTTVMVPPGSWLGVMGKQMLGFSYHCPSGYCKTTLDVNISRSHDICTGSRQGTLCGQCQKGYSVVLGSVECRKCTDSSSFIIPVYIGAAVIYVSVLFTLRLTVDVGTIGGLVFWVDGMTIANDMLFNMFGNQGHIAYLYTVLNAFHCQWQLTTCVYSGMGSAVKQSLSFASSVFLWVIVALIIWTSRCSTKLANLLVGSGVQVLATVMYVSFSNLFISCLQVLTPAYVYTSNDSTPLVVWYTDGTLLYGKDPAHIGLMCVSIMTLLFFVIPYVLIGLFGKKVLRFYYIVKYLRPYIEALHGPYKHGKGYWFGLRLIVLCAMFIIHCSFGGRKLEVEIFLIFIVLGVYILALALIVPFNSKALNALELVLSALLLLYFTTISLFYAEENWSKATRLSVLGTTTLIGLLILVYHIALSCKKLSRRNCYKLKFPNVQLNKKMRNFIDPEPTHARLIEPDCDNENEDLRRNELQYETW